MKYYHVLPNACCEFDDSTVFHNVGTSAIYGSNIGLIFDWWPIDDLFLCYPEIFCTERLKFLLKTNAVNYSGIGFHPVKRVTTGSNWDSNYPSANPGNYWQLAITGNAFEDDFGFWSEKRYLVISGRALRFLLLNHVTEILGYEITNDVPIYFESYEQDLKANRYTQLPPNLLDMKKIINGVLSL